MPEIFDILTKDFIRTTAVDVPDTFTELAKLEVPTREAGRYVLDVAFVHALPSTNNSMEWYITYGTNTSQTFSIEHSDTTDEMPTFFGFEIEHTLGTYTATFHARKTGGGDSLDFTGISLSFKRVG